jgi:hypothetical protein
MDGVGQPTLQGVHLTWILSVSNTCPANRSFENRKCSAAWEFCIGVPTRVAKNVCNTPWTPHVYKHTEEINPSLKALHCSLYLANMFKLSELCSCIDFPVKATPCPCLRAHHNPRSPTHPIRQLLSDSFHPKSPLYPTRIQEWVVIKI